MKKNIFIIGFAKSGTTLLANELNKHGFVFSSYGKEPSFFDYRFKELKTINNNSDLFKKYINSFPGDKTIDALPWKISKVCAQKIKELFPDAYIICCVRNPLERALSHYYHLNRLTGIEIKSLIDRASQLNNEDIKKFGNIDILSNLYAPMPKNIFISNFEEIIGYYRTYFSDERVFIFDLDKDNDQKKLNKNISLFLDEDIDINLNKKINSKNNQFNPAIVAFFRKIDHFMLINKIPVSVKEYIKSKLLPLRKKNVALTDKEKESVKNLLKYPKN